MNRSWFSVESWLAIGAAAWLAGAAAIALPTSRAVESPHAASGFQSPALITNPYHAQFWSTPERSTMPAPPTAHAFPSITTSPKPVAGAVVDAGAPALYRLPRVSSFAPAPTKTEAVAQLPAVPPPLPPVKASAAGGPRTVEIDRVADVPADVDWRVVEVEPTPAAESHRPIANVEPTTIPRVAEAEVEAPVDAVPQLEMPVFEPMTAPVVEPSMSPAAPDAAPCVPTTTELTPRLLPAVQRGYALAQRGAMYAARAEFVLVLRRIAQAKDAATNCDDHSQALAAGLRAIDEAEDFVPDGVQVEADLDVWIVASSHRSPVLGDGPSGVSPHEAVAVYHRFAQEQLAAAVAGEQAGSMVLHGLGKVSATLAQRSNGDPAMTRSALTMYSAALAACPSNHLAANELGVLLVRDGRADEAARLFERAIDMAPSATAYHNLAVAQGKLGFHGEAAANEQESQRLAAMERANGAVSKRAGVEWVSPDEMAGVAQPAMVPTAAVPPRRKSPWQKMGDMARSLPLPGAGMTR